MPEAPITPEIGRDLGRGRFGEAAVTANVDVDRAVALHREGKAEQALQEIALGKHVPHDAKDVKEGLRKRYSTERDADGKKVDPSNPEEMRRLRNARTKTEMYRNFLETGTVTTQLRADVRGFLERSSAAFQDSIQGKTPAEIDAMVDNYVLNDPLFRSTLRGIYEQRADPKKTLAGEKEVHDLELGLAKLEAKMKGEVSDVEIAAAESNVATTEAALVASGVNLTEVTGYQSDFDGLAPQVNEARSKITTLQTSHDSIRSQIDTLEAQLAPGTGALTPGSREYINTFNLVSQLKANPDYVEFRRAQQVVDRYNNAKGYLDALTPGQKTSLRDFSTAQEKLVQLKTKAEASMSPQDRADLEAQIKNMKIELSDARDALQAEMIADYRDTTHMAEDAVQQVFAQELTKLPELYRAAIAERKEQEDKTKEKDKESLAALSEKLNKVWKDPRMRRGIMSLVTNRARAGQWVNAWMQQGHEGVRSQMRALSTVDLRSAGLTPQEITLLRSTLANNDSAKVFLADKADEIAAQALGDYFGSGGRFGRAEATAFTSSPQGRDLIQKALTSVDQQREARNAMAGRGALRGIDNIIGGQPLGERAHSGPARIGLALMLLMLGAAAFRGAKG